VETWHRNDCAKPWRASLEFSDVGFGLTESDACEALAIIEDLPFLESITEADCRIRHEQMSFNAEPKGDR